MPGVPMARMSPGWLLASRFASPHLKYAHEDLRAEGWEENHLLEEPWGC